MSKNAQPLAGLRQTLDQAEELIRDGLGAFAALRLGQFCTEAGEIGSALAAEALNGLGQPAPGAPAVRLHVPQREPGHFTGDRFPIPHTTTAAS